MSEYLDLILAGGLLLIAAVVFVALKVHDMPVKGVRYVVGALLALMGWSLFNMHRSSKLKQKIAALREELEARRIVLEKLYAEKKISQEQYNEARSKLADYEAAFLKSSALLREQDAQRRRDIEGMSSDEVNRRLGITPAGH